jgi:ribulose-5-phosphate 4-epimerase/fuculose-1-phosphate aldolase
MLHHRIYELRGDVNAIFHGHGPEIMRLAKKAGYPETERWHPYGTVELVRSVDGILKQNTFIIMKNHDSSPWEKP